MILKRYDAKDMMPMPIHTRWFDDTHTIAYYEFEERWTWDDLYAAVKSITGLIDSVPHRVDVIFDVKRSIGMPGGAIGHLTGLSAKPQANFGVGVMVGGNNFLKTMVQIFLKLYPRYQNQHHLADNVETALTIIAEKRAAGKLDQTIKGQKP
jgi:hypothetical protein